MHKPLTVPALSLCIVTLWACSHDTTAPPEGRPIGVFSVQPSAGRGLPIHNIIDLTLSVQGTLTPGSPVNVSVDAKSFYDIGDVLITISLPEVAVAAADG